MRAMFNFRFVTKGLTWYKRIVTIDINKYLGFYYNFCSQISSFLYNNRNNYLLWVSLKEKYYNTMKLK